MGLYSKAYGVFSAECRELASSAYESEIRRRSGTSKTCRRTISLLYRSPWNYQVNACKTKQEIDQYVAVVYREVGYLRLIHVSIHASGATYVISNSGFHYPFLDHDDLGTEQMPRYNGYCPALRHGLQSRLSNQEPVSQRLSAT